MSASGFKLLHWCSKIQLIYRAKLIVETPPANPEIQRREPTELLN